MAIVHRSWRKIGKMDFFRLLQDIVALGVDRDVSTAILLVLIHQAMRLIQTKFSSNQDFSSPVRFSLGDFHQCWGLAATASLVDREILH